jgi:hypothetical protein
MQLPRGTFREIRKNVAIESLLHELEGEKFSGVANISSPSRTGSLVFKAGKCILVKVQNSRGDAGWDEIVQAGNVEVDAAISLLGDAQIDLALEFNKTCRILRTGKQVPAQAFHRPAPSASPEPPRAAIAQKTATPVAPLKPPVKPAPTHHRIPAQQTAPQAPSHTPPQHPPLFSKTAGTVPPSPPMPVSVHEDRKKHETEEPSGNNDETSSFENDLDTFDTMDFENVTDKIRTDCKTMIKQLHLDHLMER